MADDWHPHYHADFLDGVATLPLELIGAYIVLLDTMYLLNRPLHDDDAYIAGLLRVSTRKARSVRDQLVELGKLEAVHGKLDNVRAKLEREKRANTSRVRSEAGRTGGEKSGESRRNKDLTEASASSKTNQKREEEKREDKPPNPPRGGRGSTLPDDWKPSQDLRQYAEGKGLSPPEIDQLAEEMRDWAAANRGRAIARKTDWNATFRGFVRRHVEKRGNRGGSGLPLGPPAGARQNCEGWEIPHGTAEYQAWREYYTRLNSPGIYDFPDKPGTIAKAPVRWPSHLRRE